MLYKLRLKVDMHELSGLHFKLYCVLSKRRRTDITDLLLCPCLYRRFDVPRPVVHDIANGEPIFSKRGGMKNKINP